MNNSITIFEKIMSLVDWSLLQKHSVLLNTDYKISSFFTKDHLTSMIFFHIYQHSSLRDLTQSINGTAHNILTPVSLSTLYHHNNTRDYQVFLYLL